MKQQELSVLTNVISVARRELADRDDEEIPARLKKVARSTARRLPHPFAVSLINELRSSESFRESVLERWESSDIDDLVGEAFLRDPDAGAAHVTELAEAHNAASLAEDLDRAKRTISSLEEKLDEAKKRLVDLKAAHRTEITAHQAAAGASRVSLEKAVRTLTSEADQFDDERGRHAAAIATLESEIEDLKARLRRAAEKARKKAHKDDVKVRHQMAPPSDPVELAVWLDTVERQQRGFREAHRAEFEEAADRAPLFIPDGLLPDSSEALAALIGQQPDVIYVDGYNVAAMLVSDFATTNARSTVAAIADRLAVASKSRVVVVFDAVGVEGRPSGPSPGRAEVRFTHSQIADDEIVALIRANPSRAVVITSDKDLSNRCGTEGCVTVWSQALVRWAGR